MFHAILSFSKDLDATYRGAYEEGKTLTSFQQAEFTLGGILA